MARTAVYRHYDESGALLYVGASMRPKQRLAEHRCRNLWAKSVTDTKIDWYDSWAAAHNVEIMVIREENPLNNKNHKKKPEKEKTPKPPKPEATAPELIIDMRKANGWSQSDLAEQLGVDQATVSRIERGSVISGPLQILLSNLASASKKRHRTTPKPHGNVPTGGAA